jgi:hypothetical protein
MYELGSYIPEDDILHNHHREHLKFYTVIIDVVINFCRSYGHAVALGVTQPLAEMSTRNGKRKSWE